MNDKAKRQSNSIQRVWLVCVALTALAMLYGVIRYPHAPIRLREDGVYRDKAGREVTPAQADAFKTWERCLLGSFAVLALASIPLAISRRRPRTP